MSFELAPGTLLNNRYQIKKVITFSSDGGVYVARDLKVTDKNWIVKELIPADLPEEMLTARRALFTEAVESAMQFDQISLPRILDQFSESRREYVVMEFVDGVTLQVLCDMSVNPLPEKQILTWSLQICDALIYLHNRPKPFIFHALSPAHIILTPDERIKLINYGLDRFFGTEPPPEVFAADPNDVLKDFAHFGETLCFLLTKEKPGIYGLPQGANVSPETAKVVNRTLQGEAQKTYNNFEDVRKDLELALNPPALEKRETTIMPKSRSGASFAPISDGFNKAMVALLTQKPAWLFGELALFLVVIIGGWLWINPPGPKYHKAGDTGYVSVGFHDIVALSVASKEVVDRQNLKNVSIGDLAVFGNWLYVSDANTNRVLRFDTNTDEMPENHGSIPVDRNPTKMAVDEKGKYLYVVHEPTHNVSRINLSRDPPAMDAIMAVGNKPVDIAVSAKGDVLFVSNAKDSTVAFMDPDTNKNLGNVQVGGSPAGLASSPEGSGLGQLWVCVQDPDSVVVIDIQSREVKQTIADLQGGKKPTSARFSADGSKVFVTMNGSSSVVVFDTARLSATKSIQVGEQPTRLVFTPSNLLWVVCAGPKGGISVIDPSTDSAVAPINIGGTSGPAAMAK